jgi:general secretion pathway protein F
MHFEARAIDATSQRVVTLALDALDEEDAKSQLHDLRLTPLVIRKQSVLDAWVPKDRFDADLLVQELHALIGAGLTLIESLETLIEKERRAIIRTVYERLLADLHRGHRLSFALRAQRDRFPALLSGIVEAAENTGDLVAALDRYLTYAQSIRAVRQKIISATIYPCILLVLGVIVVIFLMGWVVPRFAAVYRTSGRDIPWGSQLLLQWGQMVAEHPLPVGFVAALVLLALVLGIARLARDGDLRVLGRIVPGATRWLELMTLSRLYLTLGLLLKGGLPIQQSLSLSRSVLPGAHGARLDEVNRCISEGLPLSDSLASVGLSSAVGARFIRAGERSGQIPEMLQRAAQYHDAETTKWVDVFSKVFEPLLMVAIGLVIGLIVLLLYIPVFDLAGSF